MNRIKQLFQTQKANILNIYFTAGYPQLSDTFTILKALQDSGAHMVEIGMPYSDPIADGETIQASSLQALNNGMDIPTLLSQLQDIRQKGITIPILLMGYFNPILQYGEEAFLQACQSIGIDGLIIPDLPIQVYQQQYHHLFQQYGIYNTFLITPQTTTERIHQIDQLTEGFIYMVSSASTTGAKSSITTNQEEYFQRIHNMNLQNPKLIGFGISNHQTFIQACQSAQGAIIGSAFVQLLSTSSNPTTDIPTFIKSILNP